MVVISGTMNMRVGLLFVLLLGASWASDARQLESVRISKISGKYFNRIFNFVLVVDHLLLLSTS